MGITAVWNVLKNLCQLVTAMPTYAAQNAGTQHVVQERYPFMSNYSMDQKHLSFSWDILQFCQKKYFVSVDFQLRVEIKSPNIWLCLGDPSILPKEIFCVCGFSAKSGNKIAKHLALSGRSFNSAKRNILCLWIFS